MGWMIWVRFPAGAVMGFFSFCHCIQTTSGAHVASYPMSIGGFFYGSKVAGA